MSVRTKLLIFFLPLALLPAALVCYFAMDGFRSIGLEAEVVSRNLEELDKSAAASYNSIEEHLTSSALANYDFLARQMTHSLAQQYLDLSRLTETIARSTQLERYLMDSETNWRIAAQQIHPMMEDYIRNYGLVEISVLDTQGKELIRRVADYVAEGGDPLFDAEPLPNADDDESGSGWFQARTRDPVSFFMGAIYFDQDYDSPCPVISITAPLKYKIGHYSPTYGDTLAFLHVVLKVEDLFVSSLAQARDSRISIMATDRDRRIIYHQDSAMVGKTLAEAGALSDTYYVIDRPVLDNMAVLFVLASREQVSSTTGIVSELAGSISQRTAQTGSLSANVAKRLNRFHWASFIITLAGFLVVSLAAFFVARRITRPLSHLANATMEIAQGNLSVRSYPDKDAGREISQLSATLNTMRLRLKDHIENLDRKVEERTVELMRAKEEVETANRKLREANEKLEQLSLSDFLTGIPNRRSFDAAIAKEWRNAVRTGKALSVIMLDIDFFKSYNDTFGHTKGDECLRAVGGVLSHALKRPTDFTARYGGEEFVIILPDTDLEGAEHLAENIRLSVAALSLEHPSGGVTGVVTVSLGVACMLPGSQMTAEDLVRDADLAMYKAKSQGRNTVRSA